VTYREFVVPAARAFLEELGVEPVAVEDAEMAGRFEVAVGDDVLDFTYDIHGRSIRALWSRHDAQLVEVFREGAVRLSVYAEEGQTLLRTEFETDSLSGSLVIRVFPDIAFEDSLLLV
jgi:hypothetical protein